MSSDIISKSPVFCKWNIQVWLKTLLLSVFVAWPIRAESTLGVNRPTPKYLYFWIHSAILTSIANQPDRAEVEHFQSDLVLQLKQKTKSGRTGSVSSPFPFFRQMGVTRNHALVDAWPEFFRRYGIFAWDNPVTGMLGMENGEFYGDVLVRVEIDPRKVKRIDLVQNDITLSNLPLPKDWRAANLIYHEFSGREWVLTQPNVVKNFTADPEILKPILLAELKKLKSDPSKPAGQYSEETLHRVHFDGAADPSMPVMGIGFNVRNYAIHRIENFLKFGRIINPFLGEVNLEVDFPSSKQAEDLLREKFAEAESIRITDELKGNKMAPLDLGDLTEKNISEIGKLVKSRFRGSLMQEAFRLKNQKNREKINIQIDSFADKLYGFFVREDRHRHRFSGRYKIQYPLADIAMTPSTSPNYQRFSEDEKTDVNRLISEVMNFDLSLFDIILKLKSVFYFSDSDVLAIGKEFKEIAEKLPMLPGRSKILRFEQAKCAFFYGPSK